MTNIPNLTILTPNTPNITDFAASRNELMKTAKTDWVLFLDSDETLSPALEQEIGRALKARSLKLEAYSIPRLDTFLGQRLLRGENGSNRFTRLVKRGSGEWVRPVHEVWETKGRVGQLKNPIFHALPDVATFLDKINTYSTIEASYRYKQGIRSSLFQILVYPLAKFKLNYFWRLGILDGTPGMIMAGLMSFHSYLTWTKLFLLWHKK